MTIPAELIIKKANETLGLNVCLYTATGDPITSFGGVAPVIGTASTDDDPIISWDGSLYPCLTLDTSALSGNVVIQVSTDQVNWGQLSAMAVNDGGQFNSGGDLSPGKWTASVYGWRYAKIIINGAGPGESFNYCLVPYFIFSTGIQYIRKASNGQPVDIAEQATLVNVYNSLQSIDGKLPSVINPLDRFIMQDRDGAGYTGYLDSAGDWLIEYDDGTSRRFAHQNNNPGLTDYKTAVTGAWAIRATLTYGYIDEVL